MSAFHADGASASIDREFEQLENFCQVARLVPHECPKVLRATAHGIVAAAESLEVVTPKALSEPLLMFGSALGRISRTNKGELGCPQAAFAAAFRRW